MGKFRSSEDDIFDYHFGDVLDVLGGPSRWHPYLSFNLKIVRSALSSRAFKVLRPDQYRDEARKLRLRQAGDILGYTDKMTGTVLLREWVQGTAASYLLAALHECVHLVSDPVSQCAKESTAHHFLNDGLLEGVVEAVTEDVLTDQGINMPFHAHMNGHEERLPIARELIRAAGMPLLASLLFQGHSAGVRRADAVCVWECRLGGD